MSKEFDEFMQSLDVWIPTDEEIETWASYDSESEQERIGMVRGAKWMKKKLLKNK